MNAFGTWKVTAEGLDTVDTVDLGTYTGYIDQIAFALAETCYYWRLKFTPTKFQAKFGAPVDITIAGTEIMTDDEKLEFYKKVFEGRPVRVRPGEYYSSMKISAECSHFDSGQTKNPSA